MVLGFKRDTEIAILCSFFSCFVDASASLPHILHSCLDAFLCLKCKMHRARQPLYLLLTHVFGTVTNSFRSCF